MVISLSLSTCMTRLLLLVLRSLRNQSLRTLRDCLILLHDLPSLPPLPKCKNTFLFCYGNSQYPHHCRNVLRLHVASLFLIKSIKDLSIFFEKFRTDFGFKFYGLLFLWFHLNISYIKFV